MKHVRFHAEAKAELLHETRYYKQISPALAARFVAAVENATAIASEFPTMGVSYKHGTRRVFVKKFPFSIVYVERADDIYIVALAPFRRKPGYWRSRPREGT